MILNKKNVIVTGAANGVGRELSLKLINLGATVIGLDIDESSLYETKYLVKEKDAFKIFKCDITNRDEIREIHEQLRDSDILIDVIVNNAGIIQPFIDVDDISNESIDRVMNINFFGTVNIIKEFLPDMQKSSLSHITNVSSMGSFLPVPGQSIYGASKAAIKQFSDGLRIELKHMNTNVSVVIPGGIVTNIMKNSNISTNLDMNDSVNGKDRIISSPEHIADIILKSITSNKKTIYAGKDCKIVRLLYKISPKLAIKVVSNFMDKSDL